MLKPAIAMLLALSPAPLVAQVPAPDYATDSSWLCRPGRADACGAADLSATVVRANGTLGREAFRAAKRPEVDCFYVYPTVSLDAGGNSDMTAGAEERSVAEQQAARLRAQCRLFAPLYRQVTITALRTEMMGGRNPGNGDLAYGDVVAAWRSYLARDNGGRGVVLVGHSQGARMLKRLIAQEIEGRSEQARIVAAHLIGHNVMVPAGKDVGGDLKRMPLCRQPTQAGCVVTYVSFRDSAPPPANSRFGRPSGDLRVGCTNPAALGGGRAPLRAILPARSTAASHGAQPPLPWTKDAPVIATPFVMVPGLLSGQCVSDPAGDYLAVRTEADPNDPRTDAIRGDVTVGDRVLADWGLHLIDMHVAMADIVDLIGRQASTWRKQR